MNVLKVAPPVVVHTYTLEGLTRHELLIVSIALRELADNSAYLLESREGARSLLEPINGTLYPKGVKS